MADSIPTPALSTRGVLLVFHCDILSTDGGDEMAPFWFEDAVDLIIGVRRKIGITEVEGLVERIDAIGLDQVDACCHPLDDGRLLVAADQDALHAMAMEARKG